MVVDTKSMYMVRNYCILFYLYPQPYILLKTPNVFSISRVTNFTTFYILSFRYHSLQN